MFFERTISVMVMFFESVAREKHYHNWDLCCLWCLNILILARHEGFMSWVWQGRNHGSTSAEKGVKIVCWAHMARTFDFVLHFVRCGTAAWWQCHQTDQTRLLLFYVIISQHSKPQNQTLKLNLKNGTRYFIFFILKTSSTHTYNNQSCIQPMTKKKLNQALNQWQNYKWCGRWSHRH